MTFNYGTGVKKSRIQNVNYKVMLIHALYKKIKHITSAIISMWGVPNSAQAAIIKSINLMT